MKKAALRYAELLENGFFITQQEQDDIAKLLRKLVMTEDEAWDEMEARLNKPKEKSTVSKPWVSLTDEEFDKCDAHETWRSMRNVAEMLKEKNT